MSTITNIILLNCSIITSEGKWVYKKILLQDVLKEIKGKRVESAIGHESTAQILSEMLGIEVKVNRVKYQQEVNELGIVFQLRERPPEGKILTREEIEKIGYDFYALFKIGSIHYNSKKGPHV